jgi:SAM-dependent methyltransferase
MAQMPSVGQMLRTARRWLRNRDLSYQAKLAREVENYRAVENVHDLPQIFHYWSNKYLVPKYRQFGFSNPKDFYRLYMLQACQQHSEKRLCFVSIGAGNCDTEIEIIESLWAAGTRNFVLECLDINPHMLDRGRSLARQRQIADAISFTQADINSWRPSQKYQIIMANQALHHFVELEMLFDKAYDALTPDGFFLSDDRVGRNGHMRWPETLEILDRIWSDLPEKYKYNHQLKRLEREFDNWDCSKEGFEGIRAQDILPLLIKKFHFELFVGYGNLIDAFVERSFGHNFDPANQADLDFIDRIHSMDEDHLERGVIKPTHMTAAMVKQEAASTKTYKHLTPEFCVRWPNVGK